MFTGDININTGHTDYYDHIMSRNMLRFAQECTSLGLYYQKEDTPDEIL